MHLLYRDKFTATIYNVPENWTNAQIREFGSKLEKCNKNSAIVVRGVVNWIDLSLNDLDKLIEDLKEIKTKHCSNRPS